MWWFTLSLVAIATYLIKYYYDSIRALYLMWDVVGPPAIPFLGNAHLLINKSSAGVSFVIVKIECKCTIFMQEFVFGALLIG